MMSRSRTSPSSGVPGRITGTGSEPADVAPLIAVSESTLGGDRGKKLPAYAKGGVPVYWIVNVDDGQVEVYSNPGPSGYQSHEVLAPGHVLSVVIDGVEVGEIPVADILP